MTGGSSPVGIATHGDESARRKELVAAARRLFHERGFHRVSTEDIAQSVGLRGPALYRHFRNKREILARVVLEQVDATAEVVEQAASADLPESDRLERLIEHLGRFVLDRGGVMTWQWERRHLAPDGATAFDLRVRQLEDATATILAGARPGLGSRDLDALVSALLSSFSHTRTFATGGQSGAGGAAAMSTLRRIALAVSSCEIGVDRGHLGRGVVREYKPVGRRERIVEAATALFAARGFVEVSIDDIAAAAEVAIATLYQHFDSKARLLEVMLTRGVDGVSYVTAQRLAGMTPGGDSLQALAEDYVDLSLGPHGRLIRIFGEELIALEQELRSELLSRYHGYIDQWVGTLLIVRPELSASDAHARVRTSLGVVSDLSQDSRLRDRDTLFDDLSALATAVLFS